MHSAQVLPAIVTIVLSACMPTLQNARIAHGLHLDAGTTVITDQTRDGNSQGTDVVSYAGPVLGIGGWVEIGIPIGYYVEGSGAIGSDDAQVVPYPYVKLSMLEPGGRNHAALIFQGAWVAPANIGVRYGHEFPGWEPHVGVSLVFSGGPAGDDPFVTRYQEKGQYLMTFGAGATFLTGGVEPAVEIGLLLNHYQEGAVLGDFGQPTVPRTLLDLYVGGRIRM